MNKQIKEFQNKITTLQEVDIGDFRRRLILYINRLEEDLEAKGSVKKILDEMKKITLYEIHQDLEEIRESVLQQVSNIEKSKNKPS